MMMKIVGEGQRHASAQGCVTLRLFDTIIVVVAAAAHGGSHLFGVVVVNGAAVPVERIAKVVVVD